MKASLKIALILIVFSSIFIGIKPVKAQCAACAAAVETSSKNGDKTANGLNKGILFLLGAPYLAIAAVGFVWYKKFRRKNVNINMRGEKLNLN
jgi:hypothetical protein